MIPWLLVIVIGNSAPQEGFRYMNRDLCLNAGRLAERNTMLTNGTRATNVKAYCVPLG
jgi:hypothetical protein